MEPDMGTGWENMICIRCEKKISFNQWHWEYCQDGEFHTMPENDIRRAYLAMLTEAAYSRTQP